MMKYKQYLVGGAVRDMLLGVPSNDTDYVVVGATPQDLLEQGFTQVGASFPVFLHPETNDEYALARTERKSGVGYHDFQVFYDASVTIEDDLARRDLTINSIAQDLTTNEIIDPFNGQQDLKDGILRHTTEAFADDPLRVLRLARFAARFGFAIHSDTLNLAIKVVDELQYLSFDRIWTELHKGFSQQQFHLMLKVLLDVGAVDKSPISKFISRDDYDTNKDFWKWLGNHHIDSDVVAVLSIPRLGSFDKKEIESLRIPSHIARIAKIADLLTSTIDNIDFHNQIQSFLDQIRYDLTSSIVKSAIQVVQLRKAFYGVSIDVAMSKIIRALQFINRLDLTSIVNDVPNKKDIKQVVAMARKDAIMKSLTGCGGSCSNCKRNNYET